MYAMSGGDVTRFPVYIEDGVEESVNLLEAPAIVHKVFSEASFVASFKKKLSVNILLYICVCYSVIDYV